MPWKVVGKKVVKSDSGKVVATHENAEKAARHVKALYANYNKKGKKK